MNKQNLRLRRPQHHQTDLPTTTTTFIIIIIIIFIIIIGLGGMSDNNHILAIFCK